MVVDACATRATILLNVIHISSLAIILRSSPRIAPGLYKFRVTDFEIGNEKSLTSYILASDGKGREFAITQESLHGQTSAKYKEKDPNYMGSMCLADESLYSSAYMLLSS